ncbi:MATE family efflux transporter [Clostridiaceae bacterium AM27-36LB]|nr:MATE family efflux transporter [Clostridiales bacterium AM23-16LB]RHR46931.1 MATE family efflux transporter [Clostridiaceae bacterium AF18-31LB]RHT83163.1 MATE family efflux transporter [Clostridiaceae bacterium AM27-36LB]RHW05325.1 MATE family efflux transporter [Clostridiaceae bacterium OF09-1]
MTKDMTSGSPAKLIFGFAIPMFLGLLFQQFYSMVDTLIVGKFLGVNPLAGVGSTTSLNFMVLGFCMGVCNGFAIPVAQMFGAKEEHRLRKYVTNGAWLCIGLSVVLTLIVVLACRTILTVMDTPEEIFEYAYIYIVIVFAGIPCTFLYNILAGIIRSLGDSKTPVLFLAIASAINIGLDLIFVLLFGMGVEGPAIATVLAQGISGIICLFYMYRKFPVLHASRDEWKPELHYMGKLCFIGIPMGLQYSVTAIGSLVLQTAVNGLGAMVVAGVTAAQKINMFISCPIESLGQTMAPYAGQNMGAGKIDRIGKGLKSAVLMGWGVSIICFLIAVLFGKQLTLLFVDADETEIIAYSYQFLLFCIGGYCLLTLVNTVRFTIQGMGFSIFAILSGIMEMIARTLAALVVARKLGYIGICLAHPMAWLFADVFLIPAFFWCRKKVAKQG